MLSSEHLKRMNGNIQSLDDFVFSTLCSSDQSGIKVSVAFGQTSQATNKQTKGNTTTSLHHHSKHVKCNLDSALYC